MTHNDCTCHTFNTVFRMLGSFSSGDVFLFFHSNHNSCFPLSLVCVLVFWEVTVVSSILFFHPTGRSFDWCSTFDIPKYSFMSLTCWSMSSIWLAFSRNRSSTHFFWTCLFTSSLSLIVCIKCSSILSSVCSSNSQSFDFPRSRAAYAITLSPSVGLAKR